VEVEDGQEHAFERFLRRQIAGPESLAGDLGVAGDGKKKGRRGERERGTGGDRGKKGRRGEGETGRL
jgi:hypothetical protein